MLSKIDQLKIEIQRKHEASNRRCRAKMEVNRCCECGRNDRYCLLKKYEVDP